MKKILITGYSGFVSQHFLDFLEQEQLYTQVLGIDIIAPNEQTNRHYVKCDFLPIDLLNQKAVAGMLHSFQPDFVLHLASYSSVAFSWKNPALSFNNNTNIFLNLVEAIREIYSHTTILSIGSSEEYGNINALHLPLEETAKIDPVSPYAVARVAQEYLSKVYAKGFGMNIIMSRSFNHIGPKQKDIFVIASFAKQIAAIKRSGQKEGVLETGNLSIVRDFVDVRDVVRAYYLLLTKGQSGEIYNVCSGYGYSLQQMIAMMATIAEVKITTRENPDLVRPNDNQTIIGTYNKIATLGWNPSITIKQSLRDILNYWDHHV